MERSVCAARRDRPLPVGAGGGRCRDRLKGPPEVPMAIKYGRPVDIRSIPLPVENTAPADRLDLTVRMRRNRRSEWARRMVREHVLTTDDLIWPLFVMDGENARAPVRLDAGRRAAFGRSSGPRSRARGKADHPLHRALSLHRPATARRNRQRSAQSRQSGVPRHPRHQKGSAGDRHSLRRRARSFHQPRP